MASLRLVGTEDRFDGITIQLDPKEYAKVDPADFGVALGEALSGWKNDGKRGIWLRVSNPVCHLIDPAVMLGFDFHHAKPGYVMLTKWLAEGESRLPLYPHHQIGVAGMVLDPTGERVLCIQEKAGITAGRKDFWKLPGGLVDPNEDLSDAAVREVLEETGVHTVFDCIATIREMHSGPFGSTDLYAVCVMRLDEKAHKKEDGTPLPTPQEAEIAACEWRSLKDFLESPYYAKGLYGSLLKTAADVAIRRRKGAQDLGTQRTKMKGLTGQLESMYHAGSEALQRARL